MNSEGKLPEVEFDYESLLAAGIGLTGLFFVTTGLLENINYLNFPYEKIGNLLNLLGHKEIVSRILPGMILLFGHRIIASRLFSVSGVKSDTVSRTRYLVRLGAAMLGVWLVVVGTFSILLPTVLSESSLPTAIALHRANSQLNQHQRMWLNTQKTRGFTHTIVGTTLILSFYLRRENLWIDDSNE